MIDSLMLDALAAAGCVGLGMAARRRSPGNNAAPFPPIARSVARLPYRQRREAHAIVTIAREHLGRHANSADAFTAREALRSYLPETLAAYLAVPPALRRTRRAGSASADEELTRQLRTLRCGLERLREADADIGTARMAANGTFLHERFGAPAAGPAQSHTVAILHELIGLFGTYLRRV